MQETIEKSQETIDRENAIKQILANNNNDPSRLIPILQQIQEMDKYLSKDAIEMVAVGLDIPVSHIYGVATFYAHFSLNPKGKHIIRLCDGTACHVKKSSGIREKLYEKLGLSDDNRTSSDLMFTVDIVSCLGACGLAPVMVVDEVVHGQTTPELAAELIDKIRAEESAA